MKVYVLLYCEEYVGSGFFDSVYLNRQLADAACIAMNKEQEAYEHSTLFYYVEENEVKPAEMSTVEQIDAVYYDVLRYASIDLFDLIDDMAYDTSVKIDDTDTIEVAIAMLTATLPYKKNLKNRSFLYNRVADAIDKLGKDHLEVLKGLE